jgi:hypothetical protein
MFDKGREIDVVASKKDGSLMSTSNDDAQLEEQERTQAVQ